MSRIIVTGANGFVGRAVCCALLGRGIDVTALVRRPGGCVPGVSEWVHTGADFDGVDSLSRDADANASRSSIPPSADTLIHLAARVHVMKDEATDPDAAYDATNVAGALRVARVAQQLGVRRFVFASSIKALAERDRGAPLAETDDPRPEDAYGRSKLRAEHAFRAFGERTGMEIVIVRPPLVYGPEVRANFLSLLRAVSRGIPLPLASIDAQRSLVYVDNLADALTRCAIDVRAAGRCFHVADDDTPSVAGLLRSIGRHLGRSARLFPMSPAMLRWLGRAAGRGAQIARLTEDLRVDASSIRDTLNWRAPYSLESGLDATAQWYRSTYSTHS